MQSWLLKPALGNRGIALIGVRGKSSGTENG
jgi:hypothetical protein